MPTHAATPTMRCVRAAAYDAPYAPIAPEIVTAPAAVPAAPAAAVTVAAAAPPPSTPERLPSPAAIAGAASPPVTASSAPAATATPPTCRCGQLWAGVGAHAVDNAPFTKAALSVHARNTVHPCMQHGAPMHATRCTQATQHGAPRQRNT
eukprot:350040-Chlamydomonas_euryale.AAC.1